MLSVRLIQVPQNHPYHAESPHRRPDPQKIPFPRDRLYTIVPRHAPRDSTMWPPMYLKSKKLRFLPTRGLRGRGHAHPLINRRLVSQQAIREGRLIQ